MVGVLEPYWLGQDRMLHCMAEMPPLLGVRQAGAAPLSLLVLRTWKLENKGACWAL